MAAPTFVAEYEVSSWSTTTTPKTVSVTTAVGDVLVLIGLEENRTGVLGTPTGGTGLAWTLRQEVTATPTSDWAAAYVWTATATTAETFTMSVARTGTAVAWGWICLRWSGSDGVGASSKTNVSGGAPSLGLTTTAANSAICVGNSDWNAIDGASRTWRTVNGAAATEQSYFRSGTTYAAYTGRHNDAGATGAQTVGLSAPAGQAYSIVAVEVLGSAGTVTGTLNASVPRLTASATGTVDVTGTLTAAVPRVTSTATGAVTVTGTLAASLPRLTSAAAGSVDVTGTLAGTLPKLTVSSAGTIDVAGTLGATLPILTADISGTVDGVVTGTLNATLPVTTTTIAGTVGVTGTLAAALPLLDGTVTGTVTVTGTLTATLPVLTGYITDGGGFLAADRVLPLTVVLTAPQRSLLLTPIPVRDTEVTAPTRTLEITAPIRTLEIDMTDTVKFGDTHSISLTVYDGVGAVVDLTGTTVRLLAKSGESAMVELAATLDANPTTGKVHHTLTGTLPVGTYDVEVENTIGGVKTTSPTIGYATLVVAQDLG